MDDLLAIAVETARSAGTLLAGRFAAPRTGVGVKSSSTDMVTDADRAAEDLILARLRELRPRDAVLAEETGETRGTTGLRWIVDPLDGTTNFLFGIPHWCVSVACEDDAGIVAGVVFDPLRGETFAASRGGGATLNGRPIGVAAQPDLATSLVATGFSYLAEERAVQGAIVARLLPQVRDIRRAGSAALDLAWTACGRLHAYYEAPCHLWDRAAGVLLVREAGGVVDHFPALGPSGDGVLAAPPEVFPAFRALVAEARASVERTAAPRDSDRVAASRGEPSRAPRGESPSGPLHR